MAQLKYIVGLTVILATLCSNPINAQDKSVAKSDKDIKQAVTEQMEAIGDLVAKGNYKAAAEQMTPAAQDSFALSQIMNAGMGIQMTKEIKEQLGPMAKHLGFGDTKELEQILEKHGLSDVGLTGQMEIQVIGREMSDEDGKKTTRIKKQNRAKKSPPTKKLNPSRQTKKTIPLKKLLKTMMETPRMRSWKFSTKMESVGISLVKFRWPMTRRFPLP